MEPVRAHASAPFDWVRRGKQACCLRTSQPGRPARAAHRQIRYRLQALGLRGTPDRLAPRPSWLSVPRGRTFCRTSRGSRPHHAGSPGS